MNSDEKRRSRIDSDTEEHKKHANKEKKINLVFLKKLLCVTIRLVIFSC